MRPGNLVDDRVAEQRFDASSLSLHERVTET